MDHGTTKSVRCSKGETDHRTGTALSQFHATIYYRERRVGLRHRSGIVARAGRPRPAYRLRKQNIK